MKPLNKNGLQNLSYAFAQIAIKDFANTENNFNLSSMFSVCAVSKGDLK